MNLSCSLRQILDEQNLTIYGAAQIVAAETDEPVKTAHQRITRYLQAPPESWEAISVILTALGYEIRVEKRPSNQRNKDGSSD